jgi:hypothetical protein
VLKPGGKSTKAENKSAFIPNEIIYFNSFVEQLFNPATTNPRKLIEDNADFLQHISFDKVVLKKPEEKQFGALFDLEETNIVVVPSVDEMAVSDDTHLADALADDET